MGDGSAVPSERLIFGSDLPFRAGRSAYFNAAGSEGGKMSRVTRRAAMRMWTVVIMVVKIQRLSRLKGRKADQHQ